MNRRDFDRFCKKLKSTSNVTQWGGASVWKIGGKIFAICSSWGEGPGDRIAFKCSDLAYDVLKEQPGIIPAPYLARARWVQIVDPEAMTEADIKAQIEAAYRIVAGKLTKAARRELGLEDPLK